MRLSIGKSRGQLSLLMASVLFSLSGCGTTAHSAHGSLIGVPTTRAVQTAAQLDAIVAKLPALKSLTGTAQCDVTVTQVNYRTPGVRPGEMSNASAAMLVPSGANCPPGPYPLIAYARGTAADNEFTF